jgi:pre-mRNA-processing factor 39
LFRNSAERSLLKEHWRPVKENPYDFDAWTALLKIIEKLACILAIYFINHNFKDDEKHAREAYDDFLRRYPFCYGYWKKYADFERLHKHYEKCLAVGTDSHFDLSSSFKVYERGLEAIPLSVDLWLSYIGYVKDIAKGQRQATSKIRE